MREQGCERKDSSTDVGNGTLPPRAEVLLQVLIRYCGSRRYCWPSQKRLAADLGISLRQVVHWIAFLADAGRIEIEHSNRTNRYWIPPRTKDFQEKKTAHPDARKSAHPKVRKTAHPDARISARVHERESEKQQHQEFVAAAVPSASQNPIPELVELGMPESVRSIAEADLSLAQAVLAHARYRFARGKPVRNKAGYLVACLRGPEGFGFKRDASTGLWEPPAGESKDAVVSVEQKNAIAAAAYQRWLSLAENKREAVYQRTVKAFSFYQYQDRNGYDVISGCVKMMQQMEEEGRL